MTKEQIEAINNMPTAYGPFGDVLRRVIMTPKSVVDRHLLNRRDAYENWCAWQREENLAGGPGAYPTEPIRPGDRLTQYGFNAGGEPPNRCGVYAVCVKGPTEHLLYIGSSQHIRSRLMDKKHPWYRLRERLGDDVYLRWHETDDWLPIESSLILTLKPPFNIVGKKPSKFWDRKRKSTTDEQRNQHPSTRKSRAAR